MSTVALLLDDQTHPLKPHYGQMPCVVSDTIMFRCVVQFKAVFRSRFIFAMVKFYTVMFTDFVYIQALSLSCFVLALVKTKLNSIVHGFFVPFQMYFLSSFVLALVTAKLNSSMN